MVVASGEIAPVVGLRKNLKEDSQKKRKMK
jgi:hypothetical protein